MSTTPPRPPESEMPEPTIRPGRLEGLLHILPTPIPDERGFFVRTLDAGTLRAAGLDPAAFVQDNQSRSRLATLRGLHFRRELREGKLVRCARGVVFEVVVDLRPWSSTFLGQEAATLDDERHEQLYVPPGCAHGFQVVSDWADICYRHDAVYAPDLETAIAWDDPELAIRWPLADPILSARDRTAPTLAAVRPLLETWFGAARPEPSAAERQADPVR
jgi:dTDP-4-dehydrorhamnose 3,5-epimerase